MRARRSRGHTPLGKANARRIVKSNSPINQNLNAKWEDRGVNVIVGAIHESPAKPNWGLSGTLNAPRKIAFPGEGSLRW